MEGFMENRSHFPEALVRSLLGFIAGFLATLTFHQVALTLLWAVGVAPSPPFSMTPTQPLGVPLVISLAFWGGLWGTVFAAFDPSFPRGRGYWLAAFLFGAILPSLIALFVVLPLKGRPMAGGWRLPALVVPFLVNGFWGIGTGIFLRLFIGSFKSLSGRAEAGGRT